MHITNIEDGPIMESRQVRRHGVAVTEHRARCRGGCEWASKWRHTATGAIGEWKEHVIDAANAEQAQLASGVQVHPDSQDQLT